MLVYLIALLALIIFLGILSLDIPGLWKFGLVVLEMVAVGKIFEKKFGFSTEMGFVLLKSRKGLKAVEQLAGYSVFKRLADVGTVLAYGLMGKVLTPQHIDWKNLLAGLALLALLSLIVAPSSFYVLVSVLKGDLPQQSVSGTASQLLQWVGLALLFAGGLFSFVLLSLAFYAFVVLSATVETLFFGAPTLQQTAPGGQLLLPGINLPLIEGVLALAIVLIVHEGAHAVLARMGKIKLKSAGIVLFGIIPVGAFVEPDEEELKRKNRKVKTRVLVAGSAFNLYASIPLFLLFLTSFYLSLPLFITRTIALAFALNFIVGTINLLPIPLFDGYHIIDANIENKLMVKVVSYITLIFFALNFLPHFV